MRLLQNHNLCCTLLALCALIVPGKAQDVSEAARLVKVAASQVGTLESPLGSNRGASVDAYNLTCGKDMLGAPWCASFARWCFWQIDKKDVPGAWSPDWYEVKKKIKPEEVRAGDQALIYFQSLGRYAHTIACIEHVDRRDVTTIEGNSNTEGGREGYGVFRRMRSKDSLTFVRWTK